VRSYDIATEIAGGYDKKENGGMKKKKKEKKQGANVN